MLISENRSVNILGTRGVPAAHGGFETFAQRLALYLRDRGWNVTVYCQAEGAHESGADRYEDEWENIHRIHFLPTRSGSVGSVEFDLKCVNDVLNRPGIDLVLGYNTAIFNILQRFKHRQVLMNMDGIEWKRDKWSFPLKAWFFMNEIIGANICSVPIADHPEIARHVSRRTFKKPVMIPYGSDRIDYAPATPVIDMGLLPDRYIVSIARMEPENSILEMVKAFTLSGADYKCVVLGKMDENNAYHRAVREVANENVIFPGAIYDSEKVSSLRFHCRAYCHGHQVGGTNPSLVEALGAGNAVLAHDNKFNRWTAGEGQFFFTDVESCCGQIRSICNSDTLVQQAREAARKRHRESFVWEDVLGAYEQTLHNFYGDKADPTQKRSIETSRQHILKG